MKKTAVSIEKTIPIGLSLCLNRPRIFNIFFEMFCHAVTLIEAPMGYGKTTALKSFLKSEKIRPLWIAFTAPGENGPMFWDKFTAEIHLLNPSVAEQLKTLGFPSNTPKIARVIHLLNHIDFPSKTVVVIDDYHFTEDPLLAQLLHLLVNEHFDNVHWVLLTRHSLQLPVAEWTAKGLCHVITQNQLKFTPEETHAYCLQLMPDLSETTLHQLTSYADGWISLIYIQLLGLKKGVPIGMNITIEALVDKVLFQPYEANIQCFLIQLSMLDTFTAELAAHLTLVSSADSLLKRLHRENAFVHYNEADKTYQIHNVLRDFLIEKQSFTSEERHALHRRLGEWHLKWGNLRLAYAQFWKAGEVTRILDLLNRPENIRNELTVFEGSAEMFKTLSEELLTHYPLTYLQHLMITLLTTENPAVTEDCTTQLDRFKDRYEHPISGEVEERALHDKAYQNRMIAESMIVRKFALFNHLPEYSRNNPEILKLLDGQQSYILHPDNEYTFGSPHLLYLYFRDPGSFDTIMNVARDAHSQHALYAHGCGTGADYLVQAEYALETGDWNSVELLSQKSIIKGRKKNQITTEICATFNLIRFYLIRGEIAKASELLKQLELNVATVNNPIHDASIEMCKGYLHACLGNPSKIPEWLRTGDMSEADLFYQGMGFNHLVHGKALLAMEHYIELDVLTEELEDHFSLFSNRLGYIHNAIFKAATSYRLEGMKSGIEALKQALSKAELDGIVMPFAENAPHILDLLREIKKNGSSSVYLNKVLMACELYMNSLGRYTRPQIQLSPREIEILGLTASGLNRESIASQIGISSGTVKTHLQNIYQKLGVSGKVQAIRLAQEHKLI